MFSIDNVHFINIQLKKIAFFNIYLYLPFIIIFHFIYDIFGITFPIRLTLFYISF